MTEDLPSHTYERIKALCADGDQYVDDGKPYLALPKFEEALSLVPAPIEKWEASTWILTAIGDTYWSMNEFEKARNALAEATRCAGGLGTPFIHLRLGQALFELGNLERAKDNLARACMGGGLEIFQGEDPKYLAFLKQFMILDSTAPLIPKSRPKKDGDGIAGVGGGCPGSSGR